MKSKVHSLESLNQNKLFKVLESNEMSSFLGGGQGDQENTFDEIFTDVGECSDTILITDGQIESECTEIDCPEN